MYSRATSEHADASRLAAQKGYRDGVTDGMQQRLGFKRFQASVTENFRRVDRSYSDEFRVAQRSVTKLELRQLFGAASLFRLGAGASGVRSQ